MGEAGDGSIYVFLEVQDPSSFIASSPGIPFAPKQLLHLKIGVGISVFPLRVAEKRCNKLVSGMFEVWPRCWWMVHVKHPIPPRGFVAARRFKKVGTRRDFHRAVAMWAALFGPKKPENEHSIQVKFVPGWTAGFIEQRSMQMPSKWTSDTEEWENVSSLAWQGIIRSIEEALYCPETEVIQSRIRRFFSGVSFLTELLEKFCGLVF